MPGQRSFWDVEERLKELSAEGDPLEKLSAMVDFELFRAREGLIDPTNTASDVWADTAYRSAANEAYLEKAGKVSRIHGKETQEQANAPGDGPRQCRQIEDPCPRRARLRRAEGPHGACSFAPSAEAAITLVNMAYNMRRWCWLDRRSLPA